MDEFITQHLMPLLRTITPEFIKGLGWFMIGLGFGMLAEQLCSRLDAKKRPYWLDYSFRFTGNGK